MRLSIFNLSTGVSLSTVFSFSAQRAEELNFLSFSISRFWDVFKGHFLLYRAEKTHRFSRAAYFHLRG